MGRSASLFGVLGLVFLAFGFVAAALLRTVADPYVLLNLVAGAALVLAYLAFGFEGFRAALTSEHHMHLYVIYPVLIGFCTLFLWQGIRGFKRRVLT